MWLFELVETIAPFGPLLETSPRRDPGRSFCLIKLATRFRFERPSELGVEGESRGGVEAEEARSAPADFHGNGTNLCEVEASLSDGLSAMRDGAVKALPRD